MTARRKLFLMVLPVLLVPGFVFSQGTSQAAQYASVVKLQSHFANQGDESAAGLYVGKDQQSAYFITVRHAVVDDSGAAPVSAKSVTLQFSKSPQVFPAKVFDSIDQILDLAVVYLPLANVPPDLPQVPETEATAGLAITIVGHPAAGDWSIWEGMVENEYAPGGDVHHFTTTTNPSLAKGYSGGPEFDHAGNFLGMQVSYETTYGIAAKSGEIVAQLNAWRIPTNNLTVKKIGAEASSSTDIESIKSVLSRYEDAYNHVDSNALWRVWPNPPPKTKQAIERYFASAVSINAKLELEAPEIGANHADATVSGRFLQRFTPRVGTPPPIRDDEIKFALKKTSGVWTVVGVE